MDNLVTWIKIMRGMLKSLRKLYRRLTSGNSTEEQAIQSGIWVAGINVGDRILQLLKVVILARLLSPAAFGLLGIALLVITGLRGFSKLGFDQALIHNENKNVNSYLSTAWMIKIVRGFIIALIAFVSAPYIAHFFDEPQARSLIQAIGLSQFILAVQNPAVVYFQKELNFHKEFIYQLSGRVVDITVAVLIALVYQTVWALALGIIAMNLTKVISSYIIHEYRPSFQFNNEKGKDMFSFGKWMLASSILLFLFLQGDDAFVGWYFTATTLGFYQIAYRYSNAPATEVTQVISRVAFPAFSQVQDNVERLREGFYRVIHLATIISFPMAAGIVAVAPQFVKVVLGDQWTPMIPILQTLAVWGAIRSFTDYGSVYKAVGKPEYSVYLLVARISVIAVFILPSAEKFGVLGVVYVIIGQNIITQPIGTYLALSIVDGKFLDLLELVFYPLVGSLFMAIVVVSLDIYMFVQEGWFQLISLVVVGIGVYISAMVLIESLTKYRFIAEIRNVKETI